MNVNGESVTIGILFVQEVILNSKTLSVITNPEQTEPKFFNNFTLSLEYLVGDG